MTLKNFLDTCSSNAINIGVFDAHDNLLYDGLLYLIGYLSERTTDSENQNKAYFSEEETDAILNSTVQVWYLDDDSIGIGTDYER